MIKEAAFKAFALLMFGVITTIVVRATGDQVDKKIMKIASLLAGLYVGIPVIVYIITGIQSMILKIGVFGNSLLEALNKIANSAPFRWFNVAILSFLLWPDWAEAAEAYAAGDNFKKVVGHALITFPGRSLVIVFAMIMIGALFEIIASATGKSGGFIKIVKYLVGAYIVVELVVAIIKKVFEGFGL